MQFFKYFRYAALVPQVIATATALYDTLRSLDDPDLKEAMAQVKQIPAIADRLARLKVQTAVLKSLLNQI